MTKERILVTGANGQIGTALTKRLRDRYGSDRVVASDLHYSNSREEGPFELLDATDKEALRCVVAHYSITQLYHLPAVLSAKGEQQPLTTWEVNMTSLLNALEVAKDRRLERFFFPSSIAVFGRNVQRQFTPQDAALTPETVYGMSKVAGENWCAYYHQRYGLDVRSLRYPGVISHQTMPGGGTTDYAVEIFYKAVSGEIMQCFLNADTRLPMIYIDDAIRATVELMEASAQQISLRTAYNLAAMSFTPAEIATEIQKHLPHFAIRYQADYRQQIASTWPESINDSAARNDWNWRPQFDLAKMTTEMLHMVRTKSIQQTKQTALAA